MGLQSGHSTDSDSYRGREHRCGFTYGVDVQSITHADVLQHGTATCPARCFPVLPECGWETLPNALTFMILCKWNAKITDFSKCAVQRFSLLSQWNMFKEIKSYTDIVGNFIPRPARSLTCVLICYIWPVRRHVALSNMGFFGGIVKIRLKKQKFELTWQVPQTLAPVPAGPCDPRILGLWQKAS